MKQSASTLTSRERVRVYSTRKYEVYASLEKRADLRYSSSGMYYTLRFIVCRKGAYVDHEYTPQIPISDIKEWHREDAHAIYHRYIMPRFGLDTMRILTKRVRESLRRDVLNALQGKGYDYDSEKTYAP